MGVCFTRCLDKYDLHYQTVKLVRVRDVKITLCWYILLVIVFIYGLSNVLKNRTYCQLSPLDSRHYHAEFYWKSLDWQNLYNLGKTALPAQQPPYCNGTLNTDFWMFPHRYYKDNPCIWWYERGDVTGKDGVQSLWASTSYGISKNSTIKQAFITPYVEKLNAVMRFTLAVNGEEVVPETWLNLHNGTHEKLFETNAGSERFLLFSVEELLALSGISMDDTNIGTDGVDGHVGAPLKLQNNWPSYRLTGVEIRVIFDVSNNRHSENVFDRSWRNYITVEVDELKDNLAWTCKGFRYLKMEDGSMANVHACVVRVRFIVGGDMCFADYNSVQASIIDLIVMLSLASVIVDFIFSFCVSRFYNAKVRDDKGEWILSDAVIPKYDDDYMIGSYQQMRVDAD